MPVVVSQFWEPEMVLDLARYVTIISGGKSHPFLRTPDLDQSFLFFFCIPLNLMRNMSSSRTSYILSLLFSLYKLDVSYSIEHLCRSSSCYLPSVVRQCCGILYLYLTWVPGCPTLLMLSLVSGFGWGQSGPLTFKLLSVLHLVFHQVTHPLIVSA